MKVLSKCYSFLILLCLVSEVFLRCSRCHDFLASTIAGNLTVTDHSLVGYEMNTVAVENFLMCFDACVVNCLCMSFNFKKNATQGERHQCQLNSEKRDTNLTALVKKPGTSYHDIQATVSKTKRRVKRRDLSLEAFHFFSSTLMKIKQSRNNDSLPTTITKYL